MRCLAISSAVLALAILARPALVRACVLDSPIAHTVDPAAQAIDHVAPATPALSIAKITRGQGPRSAGCGSSVGSCDGMGSIAFSNLATDDVTPVDRIGYRFTPVAGTLPPGFTLPSGTVVLLLSDGQMWLHWDDGATDDQESIDFTLQIVAVDDAGNESAPQTLRVRDDQGGCHIAAGAGAPDSGGAAVMLGALFLVARRRRDPAGAGRLVQAAFEP